MAAPRLSGTKICRGPSHLDADGERCEVELHELCFACDASRPDKLRPTCRECQRFYNDRQPRKPRRVVASTWPGFEMQQMRGRR